MPSRPPESESAARVRKIRAFWDAQLPTLHTMMLNDKYPELNVHEKAQILDCLPDLAGQRVLELAAGIGRYTEELAQRAAHVTAVDIAPQFLETNRYANEHYGNVEFVCSDALELTAPAASYDFAFINWLFMYLSDDETQQLAGLLRGWLKRGGFLFVRESCAEERRDRRGHYYVNYRLASFYRELFATGFRLVGEGNVLIYETLCANPHQRFWLYQRYG